MGKLKWISFQVFLFGFITEKQLRWLLRDNHR